MVRSRPYRLSNSVPADYRGASGRQLLAEGHDESLPYTGIESKKLWRLSYWVQLKMSLEYLVNDTYPSTDQLIALSAVQ